MFFSRRRLYSPGLQLLQTPIHLIGMQNWKFPLLRVGLYDPIRSSAWLCLPKPTVHVHPRWSASTSRSRFCAVSCSQWAGDSRADLYAFSCSVGGPGQRRIWDEPLRPWVFVGLFSRVGPVDHNQWLVKVWSCKFTVSTAQHRAHHTTPWRCAQPVSIIVASSAVGSTSRSMTLIGIDCVGSTSRCRLVAIHIL